MDDDAVERELQAMVAGTLPAAEDLATNEKRKWLTVAEGQKTRRLLEQFGEISAALTAQFDTAPEDPDMAAVILTTAHSLSHGLVAELHESMAAINRLYGYDEHGKPPEDDEA